MVPEDLRVFYDFKLFKPLLVSEATETGLPIRLTRMFTAQGPKTKWMSRDSYFGCVLLTNPGVLCRV
jgi:hypothetical protein